MITEHTICALPEDHVDYRNFAIKVQRKRNDKWVLVNDGFYLDPVGDWLPSAGDADEFDEGQALTIADDLAPNMTVNGFTVADALEWGRR